MKNKFFFEVGLFFVLFTIFVSSCGPNISIYGGGSVTSKSSKTSIINSSSSVDSSNLPITIISPSFDSQVTSHSPTIIFNGKTNYTNYIIEIFSDQDLTILIFSKSTIFTNYIISTNLPYGLYFIRITPNPNGDFVYSRFSIVETISSSSISSSKSLSTSNNSSTIGNVSSSGINNVYDVIISPDTGTLGNSIFKIANDKLIVLYKYNTGKNNYILAERNLIDTTWSYYKLFENTTNFTIGDFIQDANGNLWISYSYYKSPYSQYYEGSPEQTTIYCLKVNSSRDSIFTYNTGFVGYSLKFGGFNSYNYPVIYRSYYYDDGYSIDTKHSSYRCIYFDGVVWQLNSSIIDITGSWDKTFFYILDYKQKSTNILITFNAPGGGFVLYNNGTADELDNINVTSSSIEYISNNLIYVSYIKSGNIILKKYNGILWSTITNVDSYQGNKISLSSAYNSKNNLYLAYAVDTPTQDYIVCNKFVNQIWIRTVIEVGNYSYGVVNIEIDKNDIPHIVYYKGTSIVHYLIE